MKFLLVFLMFVGLARAAQMPLLAVEDLRPRGLGRDEAAILSERLRAVLLQSGKVRVLERSEMDRILKEQAFQASGACERGECAVEIGRLLAVDRMVVGTVGKIGDQYVLAARILDVQSGEVLFDASQDGALSVDELLAVSVPRLGERLAQGALVARQRESTEVGAGDLQVELSDTTAVLFLDGKRVLGRSPFLLEGLPAGVHLLEARTATRRGAQSVHLQRDDLKRIELQLDSGMSSLKVFSEPSGAAVFPDDRTRRELGTTPLKLDSLLVGSHQVYLRKTGWLDTVVTASLVLDRPTSLKVRLRPAGYLVLDPAPEAALLLIHRRDTLRTHAGVDPIALPPGRWKVVLHHPMWDTLNRDVEIRQGATETLEPQRRFAGVFFSASAEAEVWIDEQPRGRVPMRIDTLAPGRRVVTVRAPGKQDWRREIFLRKGDETMVDARLESRFSSLRVRTGNEARITLDGTSLGAMMPEATRHRTIDGNRVESQVVSWVWSSDSLEPGPHRLVVQAPDRVPWERDLSLTAGLTTSFYASLPLSPEVQARRRERVRTFFRVFSGGAALVAGVAAGWYVQQAAEASDEAQRAQDAYRSADTDFAAHKARYDQARADERDARGNAWVAGSFAVLGASGFALTWVF